MAARAGVIPKALGVLKRYCRTAIQDRIKSELKAVDFAMAVFASLCRHRDIQVGCSSIFSFTTE